MKTTMQKTKKSEYKKIGEIYMEGFGEEYSENWTPRLVLKKINLLSKYCDMFTMKKDKETIGFMALNPTKWFPGKVVEIEEFAIAKKDRGNGYGKKFLKEITKQYKQKGYENLIFISYNKTKASKQYKKMGYKKSKDQTLFEVNLK